MLREDVQLHVVQQTVGIGAVTLSPASGERGALRGYRWQYDHIAAKVYDALIDDDFVSLRLTDPEAGRVDDLVLARRDRVDGYQFKSVEHDGFITLRQLVKPQRTRSGNAAPSLIRSLADGWTGLRAAVHLVMQLLPSVNDHLAEPDAVDRPSPDHFSAFIDRVLLPLRRGELTSAEVPTGWQTALRSVREATALPPERFDEFLRSLYLDLGARTALPSGLSTRREDIIALANALYRLVSEALTVVELDRRRLLELMRWSDRPRLRSRHEFPVDLDTYAPLDAAIKELNECLGRQTRGYIAVIGPPGAGKSTLLSQMLTGCADRVIRYYAYVPGLAPARTRLTARAFLHDLVVMLDNSGLKSAERQLTSQDRDDLRRQLHDQFDEAAEDYRRTARRTIVVVDGLDHVERDHPGEDGLLVELPKPNELPDGVIIVAGSRTLAPLSPYARQQVEEHEAVVDLVHHRLTTGAVLEICRCAAITASLSREVHRRIAQLCAGHPLALSYVLNRLRDAEDDDPETVLATTPAYEGDIAAEYRAVWDAVDNDADVVTILATCSRLRVGFTTQWLSTWVSSTALYTFRRRLLYLFRRYHDGWHFFHDSFRQFAADRTARGDHTGGYDPVVDAAEHARVADLCRAATSPRLSAEELYHRYCAGDAEAVLLLGQQQRFREQCRQLRSPEAIRTDIGLVLRTAAEHGDVPAMLRMLLALVEASERTRALEYIDMPSVLYDAGLIDEAIGFCGGEITRQVPLAYAYELAARLGLAGDPAGRRIFDVVEHDGFEDPDRIVVAGTENNAAQGWARAAPLFRSLSSVLPAARALFAAPAAEDPQEAFGVGGRRVRYSTVMQAMIDTLTEQQRTQDLLTVDAALADDADQIAATGDADRADVATIVGLRVHLYRKLVALAATAEQAREHVDRVLVLVRGAPLFYSTMLDLAELAATYGAHEAATALVANSRFGEMLTVDSFSYTGEVDAVERYFRYWRLRYVLHPWVQNSDATDGDVPQTAGADTPVGDSGAPSSPIGSQIEDTESVRRIDAAVRTLARLDAATRSDVPVPFHDAWAAVVALLDVFPPLGRRRVSATLRGITQQKPTLMRLLVSVVVDYRRGLPEKLTDLLSRRFQQQPDQWSTKLKLQMARQLRSAGISASWYTQTLVEEEKNAREQNVSSRLGDIAALVHIHSVDGNVDEARRLARSLVPMAFGVGYRKDYQFDEWVAWLRRALNEPGGHNLVQDAIWLARLLIAVEPMTEGAPGAAAAELPAAVASAAPLAAVRIFEYLVRHGTVNHLNTLAALVGALLDQAADGDRATVDLAADLTAELIAPASNQANPEVAQAVIAAAHRTHGTAAATALAESVADRTDKYALPTTRLTWREALGVPSGTQHTDQPASDFNEHEALVLTDGRRMSRTEVARHISSVADIANLRRQEASRSNFSWVRLIKHRHLSVDDLDTLAVVFDDATKAGTDVLALLAEKAHRDAHTDTARRLADKALRHATSNSWSGHYGGARRRAYAVAVRVGGPDMRRAAARNLADHAVTDRWFASMLAGELADVVDALDPDTSAITTWPEVRGYLEGMAETLTLPDDEPLTNRPCRWWILGDHNDQRASTTDTSAWAALAELTVGHLSHPTWVVHDAATRVVVRALSTGDIAVAEALARFAQPAHADDILESAGRCLAAGRDNPGYTMPACLTTLNDALAAHSSHVLRDLADHPSPPSHRPLPPLYHLTLPPPLPDATIVGYEPPLLMPHEAHYDVLATGLGLDHDTLLHVAQRYAADLRKELPGDDKIRAALQNAQIAHAYPSQDILASRAAFGHVLADLTDARLLEDLPPHIERHLRTVDMALVDQAPQHRPSPVPPPPAAGHDQTAERWLSSLNDRLNEYVSWSKANEEFMIGATARLTVLNWDHPEEEFTCGTSVGRTSLVPDSFFLRTTEMRLTDLLNNAEVAELANGDPIVLSNTGWTFHQLQANWIAFRPDIAAKLRWIPDPSHPGRWRTAQGKVAVETVRWVDGWPGRAGPAFNDTEAEGYAVILTRPGFIDITSMLGTFTLHYTLARWGRQDGEDTRRVSVSRCVPGTMPPQGGYADSAPNGPSKS